MLKSEQIGNELGTANSVVLIVQKEGSIMPSKKSAGRAPDSKSTAESKAESRAEFKVKEQSNAEGKSESRPGPNNRPVARTTAAVLKVLREYTDEEHPMKPSELAPLVRAELVDEPSESSGINPGATSAITPEIKVDARAIDRHITHLTEMGFDIIANDNDNIIVKGKAQKNPNRNYFISSDFGKEEIRFLIDSVLCSKVLTETNKRVLIGKLEALISKHQRKSFNYTENVSTQQNGDNISTLHSVSTVNAAIEQKKQIEFRYVSYKPGNRMKPKLEYRNDRTYQASVYHMLVHNNKMYVVCNINGYDDMSYYKLDKMTDVRILDDQDARPLNTINGWAGKKKVEGNLPHFVYMYNDAPVPITLRAPLYMMDQLVDWLGKDASYRKIENGMVKVNLKTSPTAMKYWALQYGEAVEILEPADLRDQI